MTPLNRCSLQRFGACWIKPQPPRLTIHNVDTRERPLDCVLYFFLHLWFGLCRAGVWVRATWHVCSTARVLRPHCAHPRSFNPPDGSTAAWASSAGPGMLACPYFVLRSAVIAPPHRHDRSPVRLPLIAALRAASSRRRTHAHGSCNLDSQPRERR